jgi:chorismate mutase
MMVAVEVAGARHVEQALAAGVDILWIGARTTANPFMMQEVADALQGVDIPVLVKNPVNPDIELWKGAFERLHHAGLTRLALVLRGCTPFTRMRYRNNPQWQMFVDMRQYCPALPALCDPSHMAGAREYVSEISQKALDLGFDGLIVESHINPACALSDSAQQLTPAQLHTMLDALHLRHGGTRNDAMLIELRTLIDELDNSLIGILAQRMDVARNIGLYKREHNLAVLQQHRWDRIVEKINVMAADKGLDSHFVEEIFKLIHQNSIECQVEIMEGHK